MSGCPFHRSGPPAPSAPRPPVITPISAVPTQPSLTEDDLSCPICLRLLCDPTQLDCGHTFCSSCLRASEAEGRLECCPLCRCSLNGQTAINFRPNVLLATLIQKFFPDAATHRRLEVAQEREAARARHALMQTFLITINKHTPEDVSVLLQVESRSRCPMHAGATIPIGFYVASAMARFPETWTPHQVTANSPYHAAWEFHSRPPAVHLKRNQAESLFKVEDLASMSVRGLRRELQERQIVHEHCLEKAELVSLLAAAMTEGDASSSVAGDDVPILNFELHFQPRFQLEPVHRSVALKVGVASRVSVEFDSRVIHS